MPHVCSLLDTRAGTACHDFAIALLARCISLLRPPGSKAFTWVTGMGGGPVLLRLSVHISNCLELAAQAEQRARAASDAAIRSDNERLAQSWRHLARSYQFVESLERFLADTERSKDALPPEMPALAEEMLAAPEPKPIIRRRRVKQTISFKQRLLRIAQEAREEAARLPAGAARERLLLKARQSETAANIDTWISSPGSAPPDNLGLGRKPRF